MAPSAPAAGVSVGVAPSVAGVVASAPPAAVPAPPAASVPPLAGVVVPPPLFWETTACCGASAVAEPLSVWEMVPCCCAAPTACASGLSTLAAADASIGAATFRFAAAARSTGAARSSPRSTLALTSSRDSTSLFGNETASSASISSMDTRSFSSTRALLSVLSRSFLVYPPFGARQTRRSLEPSAGWRTRDRIPGPLDRAAGGERRREPSPTVRVITPCRRHRRVRPRRAPRAGTSAAAVRRRSGLALPSHTVRGAPLESAPARA